MCISILRLGKQHEYPRHNAIDSMMKTVVMLWMWIWMTFIHAVCCIVFSRIIDVVTENIGLTTFSMLILMFLNTLILLV